MFPKALAAAAGTVVAAAATGFFVFMDANPSLYWYDKIMVTDKRLKRCLEGQRIWITGASSGIGSELALQLASQGANLILSARSKEKLELVATKCRQCRPSSSSTENQQNNNNILVLPLDVTCSQQELEKAVDTVLQSGEELDCVIFNAGRGHQSPAIQTNRDVTVSMMQINAIAPIAMAQTVLQKSNWVRDKKGRFVVVSSVAGKFAVPLSASYAASKRALHGYFESLGSENPWLSILMVCPGPIATPFHASHADGRKQQQQQHSYSKLKMPVGRCASLILSDMVRGSGGQRESWIAEQPTLLVCFLSQYFPSIATRVLQKVGPIRVAMWEQGLDLYDPKSFQKVVSQPKK